MALNDPVLWLWCRKGNRKPKPGQKVPVVVRKVTRQQIERKLRSHPVIAARAGGVWAEILAAWGWCDDHHELEPWRLPYNPIAFLGKWLRNAKREPSWVAARRRGNRVRSPEELQQVRAVTGRYQTVGKEGM